MSESFITCDNPQLTALFPRIKNFLLQDVTEYNMFGRKVRGYRTPDAPSIWIRDYSDMMRAFRYWEADMKSVVDHFAETQSADGWFFDYFTMTPEKIPCEKENWAKYVRVPVEADVEYRFIKAAYLAWQATGDDEWIKELIPKIERAIHYVLTDPWRWDRKHNLVKRAYTIDTWDFDYTAGKHRWLNFQITDDTYWGILHGDNSGYYESFLILSTLHEYFGNNVVAQFWQRLAKEFRRRANRFCFNGRFYTHHIPLVPVKIEGVNEKEQLSLSNPMDINRGLATHDIAVSVLREYQRRRKKTRAFAEWFSIDPPFPAGIFGDDKIVEGAYCNGGIMPLVGGELARAAFEHGFEKYGVDILLRYEELTRNNESYLWYFPDGRHATIETSTSPDASPTDGWGSSAIVYAVMEGLAGVVDQQKLFQHVKLSPRWIVADVDEAHVNCMYDASGTGIEYVFKRNSSKKEIGLDLHGESDISLHLLLPSKSRCTSLRMNGNKIRYSHSKIEKSNYVDTKFKLKDHTIIQMYYET